MAKITIYSKPGCPFCVRAMQLLDSKNAAFKEIIASQDANIKAEMVQKSNGARTFPQIFINDKHIGGCDDLFALENAGNLDPLLAA